MENPETLVKLDTLWSEIQTVVCCYSYLPLIEENCWFQYYIIIKRQIVWNETQNKAKNKQTETKNKEIVINFGSL